MSNHQNQRQETLDEKKTIQEKLYYEKTLSLWEEFCQEHQNLYELTCDEYLFLLESNIEELERTLPLKENIIKKVHLLEDQRNQLIIEMNASQIFSLEIITAGDLLAAFEKFEENLPIAALGKLHSLLVDVIHKIQDQNKKNQIFLNKAMLTIKELKNSFTGKKEFTTYGSNGQTKQIHKY